MKKPLTKRFKILLVALALLLALIIIVTPTIASYIITTDSVSESYTPADPSDPEFKRPQLRLLVVSTDDTLTNVQIMVPDYGYPVYVRAAIIVNWLRLTDCTCTQLTCGTHYCTGCSICGDDCDGTECDDCEDCEDCIIIPECDNCPDCDENCENHTDGKCNGCVLCNKVKCTDCENCTSEDCKDCKTNCTDCEGCKKPSKCDDCVDCSTCPDRNDCPKCNDNPDDDWDVFFAVPVEGDDADYKLTLGTSENSNEIWKKTDDTGFYYYKSRVESGGSVGASNLTNTIKTPLIEEFMLLETAKPPAENCILRVELIIQTIQAIGYTDDDHNGDNFPEPAWQDAWPDAPY